MPFAVPTFADDGKFQWELHTGTPIKASKKIGKTITAGMEYVVYQHKETGELKEVELGLSTKKIKVRLSGAVQAATRRAGRRARGSGHAARGRV